MAEFPATASLWESGGGRGALPPAIRAWTCWSIVHGPAFPVMTAPGQNYWIHRALAVAPRGSVLVVDAGGDRTAGYWGGLMTRAAQAVGLAGLVIDGGIRDVAEIDRLRFPVFARGASMRGTAKDRAGGGRLDGRITIGGVAIARGDLIVGDRDGVVAVPQAAAPGVVEAARLRERREAVIARRVTTEPLHRLLDLGFE